MSTTVTDRPITFDSSKLAEEWSKPKTLMEIYGLVGRFPFWAKAVVINYENGVPVGTIIAITGIEEYQLGVGEVFATNWHPPDCDKRCVVKPHIRRWLLVED